MDLLADVLLSGLYVEEGGGGGGACLLLLLIKRLEKEAVVCASPSATLVLGSSDLIFSVEP